MPAKRSSTPTPSWKIRIYIRSSVPQHRDLLAKVQGLCKEQGLNRGTVEVVDVEKDLGEIEREAIIALPMVVRVAPAPIRRIIGSATQLDNLRAGLGFAEGESENSARP